mmetsp:Transcript_26556/g.83044  ORF Transcript_26556/g.83044 Transcript_26556/m.83044 type:complete len:242 (-) Transcript_26556:2392-3117(-)
MAPSPRRRRASSLATSLRRSCRGPEGWSLGLGVGLGLGLELGLRVGLVARARSRLDDVALAERQRAIIGVRREVEERRRRVRRGDGRGGQRATTGWRRRRAGVLGIVLRLPAELRRFCAVADAWRRAHRAAAHGHVVVAAVLGAHLLLVELGQDLRELRQRDGRAAAAAVGRRVQRDAELVLLSLGRHLAQEQRHEVLHRLRRREAREHEDHNLPALLCALRGRVVAQLLHDLDVELGAQL